MVVCDLKNAFRTLWRTPAVTGIALVSIALRVGATAVVFAAVKAVLLTPLPYAHPSELVQIRTEFPKFEPSHSDWVDQLIPIATSASGSS